MKTIVIYTGKGGVGKTTTSTSVAYLLANYHDKRVLLIDLDAQGNASQTYGVFDAESERNISELFNNALHNVEYDVHDYIIHSDYGVDIISSNMHLMHTNGVILADENDIQFNILKNILSQVENEYDICICDCGLLLDMAVENAIMAADLIISPIKIGGYELASLDELVFQRDEFLKIRSYVPVKPLITMFQKNKTSLRIMAALMQEYAGDIFANFVRNSAVVVKSTFGDGPIPYISKNGIASKDYKAVVDELLEVI